jgi:hypothetical protein
MAKKGKIARSKGKPYLTKRVLVSAAKAGVRQAAKDTMEVMGYTIIAENGWIVRKDLNGDTERIEQIPPSETTAFKLD